VIRSGRPYVLLSFVDNAVREGRLISFADRLFAGPDLINVAHGLGGATDDTLWTLTWISQWPF
jgi:hypothetical protein